MFRAVRAVVSLSVLVASLATAAPKSYQVTGEVTEVRDDTVVVLKGKEKFEIAKGSVSSDLKVGQKVKVQYTMTATSIDPKAAK